MAHDHYTIRLADGKYTIISEFAKGLEFRRHGEPWPAADDLRHSGIVVSMVQRIEELETAIRAVLDGDVHAAGSVMHGMKQLRHYPETVKQLVPRWEQLLRDTLEQKS